jgi:hypothetical protein
MSEHISETELLLAFDGELPAERNEAIHAHRRGCARCEEKWMHLADVSREVATLERPEVKFRGEETALAALAARLDHVRPEKAHWSRLVWANTLAAVAVAVTCMVALPALHSRHPAVARANATYDVDDAVPAGYVSLPYGDPALPLDDASVLPVELNAEDLEMMGIEGDAAEGREHVKAEILLGMDGWPRAIRIIDQE